MQDTQKIKRTNTLRLNKMFYAEYNPHTGEGCKSIPREKVNLLDVQGYLYLPKSMLDQDFVKAIVLTKSFHAFAKRNGLSFSKVMSIFNRIRFEHDFEYWAISTIKIQDKITNLPIPFRLRPAQRILLRELERMRLAGEPIRIIILKARQWGGSTLVEMYMMWIQQIHRKNWHLAVCAQDDGAASNISELYKRAAKEYPPEIDSINYKAYARSPKNSVNVERGGIVGIGSVNNPDQFRSYNYAMIHASEVAFWADTPKRTSKALMTSLRSGIPKEPLTFVAMESTARGVGSFFHEEWLEAEKGKSAYTAVFIPWFGIEMYLKRIDDLDKFIAGMTDADWRLWDLGATLEGINWYNDYKTSENFDEWMMNNEFPSTAEEAFTASGTMYFHPEILKKTKENIVKPLGYYIISPSTCKSRAEMKESELVPASNGDLKVWSLPKTVVTIKGKKYRVVNRYVSAADIGGTTDKADYSVLTVLDRYWMLFGGHPKVAATYRLHLHQDLFAWKAAQLSYVYDEALLAVETNSLKTEKVSGDHFLTILDKIKDEYDNLYIRNKFDAIGKDWEPKYGFHTNTSSKDMIVSALRAGLRDDEFEETDFDAYEEYQFFERKPDGTLGAIAGKHDDILMTRALAYWLATAPQGADPVKLVELVDGRAKRRTKHSPMGII